MTKDAAVYFDRVLVLRLRFFFADSSVCKAVIERKQPPERGYHELDVWVTHITSNSYQYP
jgi:hypothetical protein